jgi:hypothetical protein
MDGWMDGWMDGRVKGCVDGVKWNIQLDKGGCIGPEWMHGSTDGLDKSGCMERRTDWIGMDAWKYGWIG